MRDGWRAGEEEKGVIDKVLELVRGKYLDQTLVQGVEVANWRSLTGNPAIQAVLVVLVISIHPRPMQTALIHQPNSKEKSMYVFKFVKVFLEYCWIFLITRVVDVQCGIRASPECSRSDAITFQSGPWKKTAVTKIRTHERYGSAPQLRQTTLPKVGIKAS